MPRIAQPITLEVVDCLELERWVAAQGTPPQVTPRCQIILAAADGHQDQAIARDLQLNFKTVALWRGRFRKAGVESLWAVASGRGRKPTYSGSSLFSVAGNSEEPRLCCRVVFKAGQIWELAKQDSFNAADW